MISVTNEQPYSLSPLKQLGNGMTMQMLLGCSHKQAQQPPNYMALSAHCLRLPLCEQLDSEQIRHQWLCGLLLKSCVAWQDHQEHVVAAAARML